MGSFGVHRLRPHFGGDHNVLPPQCFSHFLSIFILYPPTGSLPVHRNRRLFGEEPQLIPHPLFLLFFNQDQNMNPLIECTNVCTGRFVGFHPPTPWSVRGGPFPCLKSRQRRVPMMETPAIQVNNLRTCISLCSSWPTLWSLSGGSSPLWELKQRQGPMIEISAIQVEDLHIGRSFWSNLPNVWPVRSGSSSLSSPTQGLKPTIRRLDSVSSNTACIFVIAPKKPGLVLGKLSEREQNESES